jgi:hypothetical protein
MARTTSAAVKLVLQDDYDSVNTPSLVPFIDTATAVVTRVAACATRKSWTLSSTELELIERWLAAHFYCQGDPSYSARSTAGASGSFAGVFGMGLDNTRYGQQAQMVDSSGCLTALAKRRVASAAWLGKTDREKLTWDQRN